MNSKFSFFEDDKASICREIVGRLEPSQWPFSIEDLPFGSALVGGSIRDALLNRIKHKPDLDFIVPSNAIEIGHQLAQTIGGKCVVLDGDRDIARLVIDGWTIDFASQIGKTLEEDLSRRDFTVNAIAIKLDSELEICDPQCGIYALKEKKLIAVSEKNLKDDPLRLLRGFRLSSQLNLSLADQTIELISNNVNLLKYVARERIKAELEKLVHGFYADEVIPVMQRIRLLEPWENKKNVANPRFLSLKNISSLTANEKDIALPLIRLTNLLSEKGLEDLGFSRKKIKDSYYLRYWNMRNDNFSYQSLSELERITLHKQLENVLPALILQLPKNEQPVETIEGIPVRAR